MSEQVNSSAPKNEKPAKVKKPSIFARIGKWFRDLKSEAKKVTWPSKKQVINNTLIVLSAVVIVGVFIAVLDTAFGAAFRLMTSIAIG